VPRRAPTLRTHLILVILGVLLPGIALTGFLFWRSNVENRIVIERRLLDTARVDADALDREFEDSIRSLEALASSPELAAGNFLAFHDEARRAVASHAGWAAIVLLDPQGEQLVHTSLTYTGALLGPASDIESVRDLVRTGAPVVGRLLPGKRNANLGFAIRVPVHIGGALTYALSAVVGPAAVSRLIVSQLPATEEWARTLLDPAWTIVAHSRDNARFSGTATNPVAVEQLKKADSSIHRLTSRDGLPVYVASSRSHYGWTSTVLVPVQLIDAPAQESVRWLIVGSVLLMTLAVATVVVVSRRLSRDLASASEAAAHLAEGQDPPPMRARVAESRQLYDSLSAAAELLHVRERAKEEFLAVLGHELRNPLAPATTALELMRLKGDTALVREREVLERQVSHLTRLVDDLLDVSRVTRGKVTLKRRVLELRPIVDRAIDMAKPLIAQRSHRFDVDVAANGLVLDADEDRLVQILVNLLTNAARYTPADGHISLAAHVDDGYVVISCTDDGPGIAPALLPTIFEPFVQAPRSLDRSEGGLGLGLALARNLTQLHGGTLTLAPVTPHGSRFIVRLPLARRESSVAADDSAVARGEGVRRRVLLVDDNTDAAEMMKRALESAGHEVQIAGDGPTALALNAETTFDTAILDIGLPGMDGYEVAGHLRRSHPRLRLIALSGYGQVSDTKATQRAGFDAHCTKPITVSALLREIDGAQADFALG
jgi:signal transduction histidine kinase/CheY-like chemotaxis protein